VKTVIDSPGFTGKEVLSGDLTHIVDKVIDEAGQMSDDSQLWDSLYYHASEIDGGSHVFAGPGFRI